MIIKEGNILDIKQGIICQQVNCAGAMGAGLALQIKNKYPVVYEHYSDLYKRDRLKLGEVLITMVETGLCIASLCGQKNYGRRGLYTDYNALQLCFTKLKAYNKSLLPIYIPLGIGCGLAGGDWNKVKEIIEATLPEAIIIKLGK